MNKKLLDITIIISAIVSLISGVGYIIEKFYSFSNFHLFQPLVIISLILLFILYIVKKIKEDKFDLKDEKITYTIKLLNDKGDFELNRFVIGKVNCQLLTKREHSAESDGASVTMENLRLKAWDSNGNELLVRPTLDRPTLKKFDICFPYPLNKGDNYSYGYSYTWPQCFNFPSDYFILKDTSLIEEIILALPKYYRLKNIVATEIYRDSSQIQLKMIRGNNEVIDESLSIYKYQIYRTKRHSSVKIEWHLDVSSPSFRPTGD